MPARRSPQFSRRCTVTRRKGRSVPTERGACDPAGRQERPATMQGVDDGVAGHEDPRRRARPPQPGWRRPRAVGAKCSSASAAVRRRFISSGNGLRTDRPCAVPPRRARPGCGGRTPPGRRRRSWSCRRGPGPGRARLRSRAAPPGRPSTRPVISARVCSGCIDVRGRSPARGRTRRAPGRASRGAAP